MGDDGDDGRLVVLCSPDVSRCPSEIYRSADLFCVLGDLGCMGTAMQLREISRERVRSVGLREGLFLVRRVWRRVNISLSYRTNARHLREIRYPRSFGIIREAPRTTENFPLF